MDFPPYCCERIANFVFLWSPRADPTAIAGLCRILGAPHKRYALFL